MKGQYLNFDIFFLFCTDVSGEFVIKEVGDTATLQCLFPPGHNSTEWILPDTLKHSNNYSPNSNSALLSFSVTDLLHGITFLCQARTPNGNRVYKHYMLLTYGKYKTSTVIYN